MNLQEERLRSHLAAYPFVIREVGQGEDGWYALTDRGKKRITFYEDEFVLRWSHRWREYLVLQGFRQVERYAVTLHGTHWVEDDAVRYVLSDYWAADDTWARQPAMQADGCRVLGGILAHLHACFDQVEEGRQARRAAPHATRLADGYTHLHAAVTKLKSGTVNTWAKWLLYNLSLVEERLRKADALYRASGVEEGRTPLSFSYFPLSSLVYWEDAWYFTGLHAPTLVPRHEDTLSALEQVYAAGGEEGVRHFLSAYASVRQMPGHEKKYLLSLLSYPQPILACLAHPSALAENQTDIKAGFQLQSQREHLLRCVVGMQGTDGEDAE
ncbi:hypothetical protein JQN58_06025 [Aneurinibacillus sp. BA2021]|nr:hypothetical protein [Aneurinibacillus sp. BA2021]